MRQWPISDSERGLESDLTASHLYPSIMAHFGLRILPLTNCNSFLHTNFHTFKFTLFTRFDTSPMAIDHWNIEEQTTPSLFSSERTGFSVVLRCSVIPLIQSLWVLRTNTIVTNNNWRTSTVLLNPLILMPTSLCFLLQYSNSHEVAFLHHHHHPVFPTACFYSENLLPEAMLQNAFLIDFEEG